MNPSTRSMLRISVITAVALWLIATLIDSRLVDQHVVQPPPPANPKAMEPVLPVAKSGSARSCTESEQKLVDTVNAARQCRTDDDCTLFDYGYPIDCMTSIDKSKVPLLREEFRKYDESCAFRVFYDCPTEPYVRLPVCRENRCAVELHTGRTLMEQTLDEMEDP